MGSSQLPTPTSVAEKQEKLKNSSSGGLMSSTGKRIKGRLSTNTWLLGPTRRDAASTRVGDAVSYLLKAITTKQSSQSSQSDSRTKVRATLHKLADRQSCRAQLIQSAIPTSDALSCFFKYFTSRQGFLSHDQGGPNCGRGLTGSLGASRNKAAALNNRQCHQQRAWDRQTALRALGGSDKPQQCEELRKIKGEEY
ncbi:hypothetical protein Anapl_09242 [Anas platyrhynchos]|uniref:Uncharacterized protein n=1 Tax=Anas platyrhynchos TaxID=8839 RepID=R0M2Y2_ANAPL|nr:hypothetical protein Anapl_09242 [Anas platyrhynchos]